MLGDDVRFTAIRAALDSGEIDSGPFEDKEKRALAYVEALTRDPKSVTEAMIEGLRAAGYSDGEVLEINQTAAYFAYANRTVLGLGCSTEGDILGLSPGDSSNPSDWSHG